MTRVTISSQNNIGRLSLKTGTPGVSGAQGIQGTIGAQGLQGEAGIQGLQGVQGPVGSFDGDVSAFISSTGDTMTGPLVIEFEGEGLVVNANAQVVNDLRVGEILRVGDFEITSNNFTTTSDGEITIDSFPSNLYSTVKYVIQVSNVTGIHATEIFSMQNGLVVYATEYATLISDAALGYFFVETDNGLVSLKFTLNNSSGHITNIHVLRHGLRF